MTLRLRTFWLVAVTLLGFYAVLYGISSTIFLGSFKRLEHKYMLQRVELARRVVNSLLETQSLYVRDWAYWDDTYAFMQDGNRQYVRSNLPVATFLQLDAELFLYFGPDGSLFEGFWHNGSNVVTAPPAAWVAAIQESGRFSRLSAKHPPASGLIGVEGRPLLVAAAPILNSNAMGPGRGTLLVGRFLDDRRLQQAARPAGLNLSLVSRPNDVPVSAASPVAVRTEGADAISGYVLIADDAKRPAAVLRVQDARWIYRQGKAGQHYLMANLAAAAVVFLIVLMHLMHRLVLARLKRLDRGLARIRDAGEADLRLTVEGNDELGMIAVSMNETLDRLQKVQQALRHEALHDPLTGLGNRSLFFQRAHSALQRLRENQSAGLAVLLIDIDHFKRINDTFGHGAGDELLTVAAERLGRCFRESDTLARMGGDEFAVLLDPVARKVDAVHLASRLLESLQEPAFHNGHPVRFAASIGVVFVGGGHIDIEQLLREADAAMYRAKREGRSRVVVFQQAMHEEFSAGLPL